MNKITFKYIPDPSLFEHRLTVVSKPLPPDVLQESVSEKSLLYIMKTLRHGDHELQLKALKKLAILILKNTRLFGAVLESGVIMDVVRIAVNRTSEETYRTCVDILNLISHRISRKGISHDINDFIKPLLSLMKSPDRNMRISVIRTQLYMFAHSMIYRDALVESDFFKSWPHLLSSRATTADVKGAVMELMVYLVTQTSFPISLLEPIRPSLADVANAATKEQNEYEEFDDGWPVEEVRRMRRERNQLGKQALKTMKVLSRPDEFYSQPPATSPASPSVMREQMATNVKWMQAGDGSGKLIPRPPPPLVTLHSQSSPKVFSSHQKNLSDSTGLRRGSGSGGFPEKGEKEGESGFIPASLSPPPQQQKSPLVMDSSLNKAMSSSELDDASSFEGGLMRKHMWDNDSDFGGGRNLIADDNYDAKLKESYGWNRKRTKTSLLMKKKKGKNSSFDADDDEDDDDDNGDDDKSSGILSSKGKRKGTHHQNGDDDSERDSSGTDAEGSGSFLGPLGHVNIATKKFLDDGRVRTGMELKKKDQPMETEITPLRIPFDANVFLRPPMPVPFVMKKKEEKKKDYNVDDDEDDDEESEREKTSVVMKQSSDGFAVVTKAGGDPSSSPSSMASAASSSSSNSISSSMSHSSHTTVPFVPFSASALAASENDLFSDTYRLSPVETHAVTGDSEADTVTVGFNFELPFPHSSDPFAVSVKGRTITSQKTSLLVVCLSPIITEGIWEMEFRVVQPFDIMSFGIVDADYPIPAEYRIGRDFYSAGSYASKGFFRHNGTWIRGNKPWDASSVQSVIVSMEPLDKDDEGGSDIANFFGELRKKKPTSRSTAFFFHDRKCQTNYMTGLPKRIRFCFGLTEKQASVNCVLKCHSPVYASRLKSFATSDKKPQVWIY